MDISEVAKLAKSQMATVTGLKPVTVTSVFKNDQGWHINVEMLEMSRIPPATDVLGTYEVVLGEDWAMLSFARKGTHLRGETASAA